MGSLTSCIKKAGAALPKADKEVILAAARQYRADGMKTQEAARKAIDDLLQQVKSELQKNQAAASGAVAVAQQSADPDTGLPQFAGADGLFIGFAAPTERLEFMATDDSQKMLNFVIMRDGQMIGFADLLFDGDTLVSLYDIELDAALRGKGDGSAVIQTLLGANPLQDVEISNIVETAQGFWESVGVPTQNLGQGEAYDGKLNWQTYTQSRAGKRAARSGNVAGQGEVSGTDTSATGAGQSGNGQADNRLNQSSVKQTDTPQFKKWFGNSKVVDADGKPLVVYRGEGSGEQRNVFDTSRSRENAVFLTPDKDIAKIYQKTGEPQALYVKADRLLDLTEDTPRTREFISKWSSSFDEWVDRQSGEQIDPVDAVMDGRLFDYEGDWSSERWLDLQAEALADHDAAYLPDWDSQKGVFKALIVRGGSQVKSATRNNGNFDPANPNILEQFAGANAATADRLALDTARGRIEAGDNAETVRQETGWSKGADGKWRFEISDADAKLKIEGYKGYSVAASAKEWIQENDKLIRLGDILDHPALFAAYPDLKRYPVSFFSRDVVGGNAALAGKNIRLSNDMGTRETLSSLLHEVQHGIQDVEGFATGGSIGVATFTPENYSKETIARRRELLVQAQSLPVNSPEYKAAWQKLNEFEADAGLQRYGKLAGEVEARNTQTRQTMTAADRMATPPSATADVADADVIVTFNGKEMLSAPLPANAASQAPRATLNFASDITTAPSVIALLEGADKSSFIHEAGHFFLEVQADLAQRIQGRISAGEDVSDGERGIVKDMDVLLSWFGVTGTPSTTALQEWAQYSLEERRQAHETFARGFERYTMEGKAPSLELEGMFNKFRQWLLKIYVQLSRLDVNLTDDVRAVMGRMLASDQAIEEAENARNMGPLFETREQAGMTAKEYDTYQFLGERATAAAQSELDTRLLKDMKWLSRAKDKAIKAAQAEAADIRRDTEMEVRREVMAQPVYQAWQILTGKGLTAEDRAKVDKKTGRATSVDPSVDNLFEAIAKMGGLDKAQAQEQWGIEDKLESGLFGKPVLRATGGRSIEGMIERLIEEGYILPGRNDMTDAEQFEELFDDQRRGVDRYSISKEYSASQEDAPIETVDLSLRYAKLNTEELQRRYGMKDDAVWRILSERRMTNNEGLDPDVLAESIPGGGFTSGDELVRKLAAAVPPQQVIQERTDELMLERYGDITSPEALNRAADEAVHNELRARVIATELKALQNAGKATVGDRNTVAAMAKVAKGFAYQIIGRQRVRDLRPSQYTAAEARSAKLAMQSLGKDIAEAALHKRNQLINNYAAKAAYEAQAEVKALQVYFRKFDKRRDSIDAGYQDQIEALLERFDFKPASLKAIDKRKSFAAWYEEQVEGGNPPDVPQELLDESRRQSYKDMTVDELRELRDTVKQIEHQGRLKNKLLLAKDKKEFDAAATEMANTIIANGGDAREVQLEGPNPVMDWFAGFAASHRKLASLFRQMDGNKDSGPMYDLIGRAMNERGTMEDVMVEKATVALREIYAPLLEMPGGITGARSKLYIPAIDASLTRGGRLSVALNWGNEANRQRIMDGDQWSQGQVQAILKTLTPTELKFVNDVWAYIDSYWPEISDKQKRLTGVEPEKVDALPFVQMAADGTEVQMRGGYYPLKYDTDRSDRADTQEAAQAAKEMMQGAITKATTRRGHTKERLKEVKRAVRKDLNVITQHITQVTHDLAWHEWLIDTNRLLADERVVSAIRDHYGRNVLKTMRDGVLGIATADVVPQTNVDKALLMLRSNVTRATMGASITTAFLQPFGLTQSMVRIGPKYVLQGLARWGGDAVQMENTVEWIRSKSDFMRLRAKTFNKELREIRGSVAGKSKTMRVVDAGLFALMQKMQMVADVPTWIGQYEKSLAEGLDEDSAIAMADRAVVESQGAGATKDLAEVQRKHPMLTQFYSYFSVTLNLAAEQTAATDFKNPAAVAGWLGDMALLMIIPAILPPLIMFGLKGGDEDDEAGWAKRIAEWQVGYLMGTVVGVRELSGAVSGFDYAGPPVGRIIADIGKAGKQTAQGEVDEPLVMAYIRLMGTAFGIPVIQAVRSYKGWQAWDEGKEGAGAQSILFGPPPKD